jgi:hypothetical protein
MVQSREPLVDDVIGFIDRVLIPAQSTDERLEQNTFYCGYDSDTMVKNVFANGPDRKVFFAAVNIPGSWADGKISDFYTLSKKIGEYKIYVEPSHQKGCQMSSSRRPGVPSANQQCANVASSGERVGDVWVAGNLPPPEEAPPKRPLSAEAGH